jgi:hypothetical protein
MSRNDPSWPPQQFSAVYHVGFETDCQRIEPNPQVWDHLFRAVENFICCDPYGKATHEVKDGGGTRFLITEEAGLLDIPRTLVVFKPDEASRKVLFVTVVREVDVPRFSSGPQVLP